MRVGVYLPILSAASRDAILTYAHAAESLGFDSLWTNSHIAVPVTFEPRYPYSDDRRPPWSATSTWLEAMTTLSFVAAATERVRIGVAVVPLITTDPLTLAKQAATIDVLSNGRFELGIGGGWLTEEGRARGVCPRSSTKAVSGTCRRSASIRSRPKARGCRCGSAATATRRSASPPSTMLGSSSGCRDGRSASPSITASFAHAARPRLWPLR